MNLFLSFKKSILVNYAMLHGICIYSAILLKVCSHGKTATASSTGVMAYLFYIFLITGNFTTNNKLKQSFNIMNLRFNFTSNKSLLINYLFSPNGWKCLFSTRSHIRGVIPCYKKNIKKVSRYSRGKGFAILPMWTGLNIPSNDRSINCNNNRILWYHRTYLENQKGVFSC